MSTESYATINQNLVNPFGGAYIETVKQNASSSQGVITCYYKIPKQFVNKQMVLEVYSYASGDKVIMESDGLLTAPLWLYAHDYQNHWKNAPALLRTIVTPSNSQGTITFGFRWNEDANTEAAIAGIVLKEKSQQLLLSCYEDANLPMCKSIPTNISNATKGDIIYAFDPSLTGTIGWVFNGTTWVASNTLVS